MTGSKKVSAERISVPSMQNFVQKTFQVKVRTEFTENASQFVHQMIYTLAKHAVISCVFRGKRTVTEQDVRFVVNRLGFYKDVEFRDFIEKCYEPETMKKCTRQTEMINKISEQQSQINAASRIKEIQMNEVVMNISTGEHLKMPKIPVASLFKKYSKYILDDIISFLAKEFGSKDDLYHLVETYRSSNAERRGSETKTKVEEFKLLKEKYKGVSQATWKLFRGFDKLVPNPIRRNFTEDVVFLFSFGQNAMRQLHMIVEQQLSVYIVATVAAKQNPQEKTTLVGKKRERTTKKKNVKRSKKQ